MRRRLVTGALGLPPQWLAMGVGAVLLGVSGLFGGLAAVPEEGPPLLEVDQPSLGQPWSVTVVRAVLDVDLAPARLDDEENHWLVIVAVVEVTAAESRSDIASALRVSGVDGIAADQAPDEVRLVRDTTLAWSLHPGLPERLGFFWEQPADAELPTEVEVLISGKTLRETFLTGAQEWLPDDQPWARVRVPVEDQREES